MERGRPGARVAGGRDAVGRGGGEHGPSAPAAIRAAYEHGETDEFIAPTVIDGVDGQVRDGDSLIHPNFRADRARQLIHALSEPGFADFDRSSPDGRPAPANV